MKSAKDQQNSDTIVSVASFIDEWLPYVMMVMPRLAKEQQMQTLDMSKYLSTSNSLKQTLEATLKECELANTEFKETVAVCQQLKERLTVADLELASLQKQVSAVTLSNEELDRRVQEQTAKCSQTKEVLESELAQFAKRQQDAVLQLKSLESERIKLADSAD